MHLKQWRHALYFHKKKFLPQEENTIYLQPGGIFKVWGHSIPMGSKFRRLSNAMWKQYKPPGTIAEVLEKQVLQLLFLSFRCVLRQSNNTYHPRRIRRPAYIYIYTPVICPDGILKRIPERNSSVTVQSRAETSTLHRTTYGNIA